MESILFNDSCSECGSNRDVKMSLSSLSDCLVVCCHEKASQEITDQNVKSSIFTDFIRKNEQYYLTTIVKYDEHLKRIVVAVREDSNIPISGWNYFMFFIVISLPQTIFSLFYTEGSRN